MPEKIEDAEIIFAEETLQDAYGSLWETIPKEKKKQLIEDFIRNLHEKQQKEEKQGLEKSLETGDNEITAKNEVQPVYAWKVYKWASKLTSELDFDMDMYYWTPEAKRLLNRLKYGSGQLIAVIGLQGSGKTALQNALACGLKKSMLLKWTGRKDVFKQIDEYANITSKYFYELLCELDHKIGRGSLLSWVGRNWPDRVHIVKSILEKGVTPNNLGLTLGVDLIDGVMEKAGRKIIDELLISYIGDFRETILIDLPDYSKQNHSEMIKDLREIQKLWEELLLIEACLLYTSPSPRDLSTSRMPSSA